MERALFIQVPHMTSVLKLLIHVIYGTGNFSKGANIFSFVCSNEARIQDKIHTPGSNVTCDPLLCKGAYI